VDGIQDVPEGHDALLSLGRSVGETGAARRGDLLARAGLLWGGVGGRLVTQLHVTAEGRREDRDAGGEGGWKDVLMEGHGFLYLQPPSIPWGTFLLRGTFHAGWRTTAPFQLTLGGPDGVRGYSLTDFPGGRRAVASVETRIHVDGFLPSLMDLGFTAFADAGAVWRGNAPYAVDSGLRGAIGAGLRIGFPPGSSTVIRADVALPIGPGASAKGPVLRISAVEWLGILNDFRSPDMRRSRRSGIGDRYAGVARDASPW
jgi:hypothetical protein